MHPKVAAVTVTDGRANARFAPTICRPMFLNALMLAGVAAAVLPTVIHLLSRSRYRTVDWGAMMFFDGADPDQERTRRFTQLVLLLVRTVLVALLALALARPVVRGAHAGPARGQRTVAVVLL